MLRAHRGRAYRVEPDWNVTKANDDRLHADDCGIAAECLRIFNFRLTNPWRIPANGAAPRGWSCNAFHVIGPGGGGGGGAPGRTSRGDEGARSDTPAHPPRPAPDSFSGTFTHGKEKRRSKAKTAWPADLLLPVETSHARIASKRSARPAFAVLCSLPWLGAHGNCQRPGGWGWRGIRGMDAAAKPPWMGSRRPRRPHPPGQPPGSRHSATKPRGAAPLAGNYGHQPCPNRAK